MQEPSMRYQDQQVVAQMRRLSAGQDLLDAVEAVLADQPECIQVRYGVSADCRTAGLELCPTCKCRAAYHKATGREYGK